MWTALCVQALRKGPFLWAFSTDCRGNRVYNEASNTGSTHKNAVTCKKWTVRQLFCVMKWQEKLTLRNHRSVFVSHHAQVLLLHIPRPRGETDWVPPLLYHPWSFRVISGVYRRIQEECPTKLLRNHAMRPAQHRPVSSRNLKHSSNDLVLPRNDILRYFKRCSNKL